MRFIKSLLILLLVSLLASCVTNFKVVTDFDKKTDFSGYKTFHFLPWNKEISTRIERETQNMLYAAARNEMEARGYTFVQSGGDLAVGISVLIEEHVEVRADGSVNYNVGYGGMGYFGGFGMGQRGPTTYSNVYYNDGTLIIDVFDEKTKNLIWEGYGFDRINDHPLKAQQKIPMYMKHIFKKFPAQGKKK